jgi:predicted porin
VAASGAASAQSSLTLFGVADSAISHYSVKSSFYNNTLALPAPTALAFPEVTRSQTALSSGANASSRVGFRGTEDLGGGLAAGFWLESGFTQDSGATGLTSFSRRSTVSLHGARTGLRPRGERQRDPRLQQHRVLSAAQPRRLLRPGDVLVA